jgi:uroporphyrinogen-III decarboxylase
MAALSKAIQKENRSLFCYLPFCNTVEAESFGAIVNMGNEVAGPRTNTFIYDAIDELPALPEMDFSAGRIKQVIDACEILHGMGENVALEICGPFTILNCLIDIGQVIKGWRKRPELMADIFNGIGSQIARYIRESKRVGVKLFCYSDPPGGLNIVGPKLAEAIATEFTMPFLREALGIAGGGALIHLCPKTSHVLVGLGLAQWLDVELSDVVSYEEACIEVCGSVGIVGDICIQDADQLLEDRKIRGIALSESTDRE